MRWSSTFTVQNDTTNKIYITASIHWKAAILVSVCTATVLVTAGSAAVAISGGLLIGASLKAGIASGISALFTMYNSPAKEEVGKQLSKREKKKLEKFKSKAEELKPGEIFTFRGSWSLLRTVTVMDANGKIDQHGCVTGSWSGRNNSYCVVERNGKIVIQKKKKNYENS